MDEEPILIQCEKCGKKAPPIVGEWEYSDKYDCLYCEDCLEWVEERCFCGKDGECEYYPNRPEKPWKDME